MNTDTASSAAITAIAAPPIDSLVELRRQHSALLQRDVAGEGTARPAPGELLGFLESASKLGRSLGDIDDRETAQGIMDYWIAQLLSQAPQAADGTRPFTLEPLDECSAQLVSDDARQLRAQAAQAVERMGDVLPAALVVEGAKKIKAGRSVDWVPGWMKPAIMRVTDRDSDAGALNRLLLGFIRLKEQSLEAYSVPLPPTDDVLRDEKVKAMLHQLLAAGVVREQPAAEGGVPAYVLAHESLLTGWSFLVEVIKQRRAFRELARGWENGGRHTGALLNSAEQLDKALDYPHLDPSEAAFLEASRRVGEKNRRLVLGFVSIGLFILAFMLWKETHRSGALAAALEERDKKSAELEKAKHQTEEVNGKLTLANAELKAKGEELAQTNQKLEQELAVARTTNSQFLSLKDQLGPRTDVPPSVKSLLNYATKKRGAIYSTVNKGMVEIFVPADAPGAVEAATPYAEALTKSGFEIPAGVPLARKTVPDTTEVRYFHREDEAVAAGVKTTLEAAKFPQKTPIKLKFISGDDAPKGFIQISVARDAFSTAPPSN